MNTATVKNVSAGKVDATAIYCESKSGNIYKLKALLQAERVPTVINKIKAGGTINVKHWTKLKEGTFAKGGAQ